jgi:hypothetical protein
MIDTNNINSNGDASQNSPNNNSSIPNRIFVILIIIALLLGLILGIMLMQFVSKSNGDNKLGDPLDNLVNEDDSLDITAIPTQTISEEQEEIISSPTSTPNNNSPQLTAQQSCEQKGGKWGIWTEGGSTICNLPTRDGGEPCKNSSECQVACEAPEGSGFGEQVNGTCVKFQYQSCIRMVADGIYRGTICT